MRSGIITTYVLLSAVVPVIWLLGIMPVVELGLDPLSILVPFLIFAIAVSHAVQMTNAWKLEMAYANDSTLSAAKSFEKLFVPGSIALIANAIGFMVIAFVDITVVREMAFVATLGVSLMIISNKILLPILLSYCPSNIKFSQSLNASAPLEAIWIKLAVIFQKPYLVFILLLAGFLFITGFFVTKDLQIGELRHGVSELKPESRYNLDTEEIVTSYDFNIDNFRVIAEITGEDSPCLSPDVMKTLSEFEFFVYQNPNVLAVEGLAGLVKKINQAYSEKFFQMENSSIKLSSNCSRCWLCYEKRKCLYEY